MPPSYDMPTKTPQERARVSAPVIPTFVNLGALWGLDEGQQAIAIGAPTFAVYHDWVEAAQAHKDLLLEMDVLMRLSAILGIYASLRILVGADAEVVAWLRRRNFR